VWVGEGIVKFQHVLCGQDRGCVPEHLNDRL
jgi:hypothetical protein